VKQAIVGVQFDLTTYINNNFAQMINLKLTIIASN